MADQTAKPKPAAVAPEVSVGRSASLGVNMGMPLGPKEQNPAVTREPDHGLAVDITRDAASVTRADQDGSKAVALDKDGKPIPAVKAPEGTNAEETPAVAEGADGAAEVVALPAFDAAVPETLAAYDKAYRTEDGKGLNMPALSADWAKNAKVDPKSGEITGGLSEDTYKYLESKGIDRETVKAVEAGQVAKINMERQAVFDLAGGQEAYGKAIAWAREKGYDAAAVTEFNANLDAGGAKRKDAIDLLMQRHAKANPPARRTSPSVTTAEAANPGGGQQGGGAKPYANYAEYQTDLRKARQDNNQQLLDDCRARWNASAGQAWRGGK